MSCILLSSVDKGCLRFYKQGRSSYNIEFEECHMAYTPIVLEYISRLVNEILTRQLYPFVGLMEKVDERKNFPAPLLGDICDPFSYNYYQHLTNFDVLKVLAYIYISYVRDLRIKINQFACSFVNGDA